MAQERNVLIDTSCSSLINRIVKLTDSNQLPNTPHLLSPISPLRFYTTTIKDTNQKTEIFTTSVVSQ